MRISAVALALLLGCSPARHTADTCAPAAAPEEAAVLLAEANALVAQAGEHPSPEALAQILPRLHAAAYAGNVDAQARYGAYVLGYWLTDELFWPEDRRTAVAALAMLRVAYRRGHPALGPDAAGLGRDPVSGLAEPFDLLPAAWIDAAVEEANRWERCEGAR